MYTSTRTAPDGIGAISKPRISSVGSLNCSHPLSAAGRTRKAHPRGQRSVTIESKPAEAVP